MSEELVANLVCDYAVAERPKLGERESGDAWVVEAVGDGVLIAVIDGAGHGPNAAECGRKAVAAIRRAGCSTPVKSIIDDCHRALLGTRGAAMSVVQIDLTRKRLTWDGVGNVEAVVVSPRFAAPAGKAQWLVVRGGVVGYDLPPLHPTSVDFGPEHWLVMATDGIQPGFGKDLDFSRGARAAADRTLVDHGLTGDDALILVARVRGGALGDA